MPSELPTPDANRETKNIQAEIVAKLLKSGAKIGLKTNDDTTALHAALIYCSYEIVSLLVKGGADVNAKNKKGESPLAIATMIPLDDRDIKLLKEAGAK